MTTFRLIDPMIPPGQEQLVIAVSPDMRPGFFLAGSESWRFVEQDEALRRFKELLGLTSGQIAQAVGVSERTVHGWIQLRPLRGKTLATLNRMLAAHYGERYVGARPDIILR